MSPEEERLEKCLTQVSAREVKVRLEGAASLLALIHEDEPTSRNGGGGGGGAGIPRALAVSVAEALLPLTRDNNPKAVSLACQCIVELSARHAEALRAHPSPLVAAVAEALGNNNVRARKAARAALAGVLEALGGAVVLERLGAAWKHKSSHAREEVLGVAIDGLRAGTISGANCVLVLLLPQVIACLEDAQAAVRKAGVDAIEECAMSVGAPAVKDALRAHSVRAGQLKEIHTRLASIRGGGYRDAGERGDTTTRATGGAGGASGGTAARSPSSGASSEGSPKHGGAHAAARSLGAGSRGNGIGDRNGHIDAEDSEEPISLSSERELAREVDAVVHTLHGTEEDWNDRIATMKRLEGIVLGDAFAAFDSSNELLKQLKDPLIAQLLDRRSSIVRQATKLLCTMGSCLGHKMDFLVVQLVPTLFKVVVITVQIMAESADSCVRHLLRCCQSHRLLTKICVVILKDRSSKLRAHCLHYLQLVLDEWHACTVERALDDVVEAVRHGLSDADAEARATARRCFSSFSHAWPDDARALLDQLDGSLQRIVVDSLSSQPSRADTGSRGRGGGGAAPQRRERPASARLVRNHARERDDDVGRSGRPRTAAPSRAYQTAAQEQPHDVNDRRATTTTTLASAAAAEAAPGTERAGGGAGPPSLRMKGGAPERVALVRVSANTLDKEERTQSRGAMHPSKADEDAPEHEKQQMSAAGAARSALGNGGGAVRPTALSTQKSTLNEILSMCSMTELSRAGVDSRWMVKVDMLNDLKEFVIEREEEVSGLPVTEVEKVVDILCTNVSHPHAKVASAALDCLAELTPVCMPSLNSFLERLLPLLFPRLVDAKQIIRELSTEVLTAIGSHSDPEMLLPGVVKSLDAVRTTKGRIGIVEFSAHYLVSDADANADAQAAHAHIRREWLHKLVPFFSDKNAELRSASTQCIIAVYNSNVGTISADVLKLPLDVREPILSSLCREIPELEGVVARRPASRAGSGLNGGPAVVGAGEEDDGDRRDTSNSLVRRPPLPSSTTTSAPTGAGGGSDEPAEKAVHVARSDGAASDRTRRIDEAAAGRRAPIEDRRRQHPSSSSSSSSSRPKPSLRPSPATAPAPLSNSSAANGSSVAMKDLPVLIASATMGGGSRVGVVDDIGRLAEHSQSSTWIQYFPQTLMVVMEALGNALHRSDAQGLESAAVALRAMVASGPEHFSEYMDLVVPRLLETVAEVDTGSPGRKEIEDVLGLLFDLVDASRCTEALLKLSPHVQCDSADEHERDTCMLQFAIKMLNRSVVRSGEDELKDFVPRIFPGLLAAFSSSSADNRKAVVFILVDMYLILGNWLDSHLAPLSTSQHKLLTIYINRAVKMRDRDVALPAAPLAAAAQPSATS